MLRVLIGPLNVLICMAISGCYQEYDYEYISLEPSLTPTQTGMSEVRRLKDSTPMPIEYTAKRVNYEIHANLDLLALTPTVYLWVNYEGETGVTLVGESIECYLYVRQINSLDAERLDLPRNALRVNWGPESLGPCSGIELRDSEQVIQFEVYDQNGEVLAEERIPFSIQKNGVYGLVDSL